MRHLRIEQMIKGWFVGDFEPTAYRTEAAEVTLKAYSAGETEQAHLHRVATEITVVVSGQIEMKGRTWGAGDIIVIEPGEATGFRAISNTVNIIVKVPSVTNDKFPSEEPDIA